MCGNLEKAMYGTSDAAQNCERAYESAFVNLGFKQGKSSPCLFYHSEKDLRVVVHGDDFTFVGDDSNLKWITAELKKVYEFKVRATLGPEHSDDKSVRIPDRIVSYNERGIQYEPDQPHVEIVIKTPSLEKGKSVVTPGAKEKVDTDSEKSLEGAQATSYRSLTVRLSYLAQDRPDRQFSCKELAKGISSPTEGDWLKLKRLGRYLIDKPRVVLNFDFQSKVTFLDSRVDTNHAGCIQTRKSTNGDALKFGKHCLKTWSTTQAVIALPSGEAEYYGVVKGGSVLLGAISMAKDLGNELKGRIFTDSSAVKGIANKRGLGKTRHIHFNYLWIQERVNSGDFQLFKERIDNNVGDLFIKYLDQLAY